MNQVYVDLDGVFANLNKACCPLFGIKYPSRSVLSWDWSAVQANCDFEAWLKVMEENSNVWERIEAFPWVPALVNALDLEAPGWKILTTAVHDPACWGGKAAWVKQRLFMRDSIHRLIMVGGRKWELATVGSILVDDQPLNIDEWVKRGGQAFRWLDYTEDMVSEAMDQIERLRQFLFQTI